jgi:uncharacterized short protein YbdD (DUF466 family)
MSAKERLIQVTYLVHKVAWLAGKLARFVAGGTLYEAYVRRRRADHPNLPVMTYDEFIERQAPNEGRPYTKV